MSDARDETADQGIPAAHTRPGETPAGAPGRAVAADVARIGAELDQAGGDQLDLLDGSPDVEALDVFAKAAEHVLTERRARGRPAGAANLRNTKVFDYLEQLGHRCPAVTLSTIQSADTLELAQLLGAPMTDAKGRPFLDGKGNVIIMPADPVKVAEMQRKAAADLLPYKFAKRPQALEVKTGKRPVLVVGEMNVAMVAGTVALSVNDAPQPKKTNEINGRAVRQQHDESHDDTQTADIVDETGAQPTD